MPLHPQFKAMLDQAAAAGGVPASEAPVADTRAMYRGMRVAAPQIEVGHVEDRRIPGAGSEIPVRIYTPRGRGPHPVLVNFHGGGWVIGDLDTADAVCREMCRLVGCVVVSVDYRLAPEHRFPAAVDDCYAATVWVASHAAELDVDPRRLAVGGESAGGNLAAVVALLARDRGGPAIAVQLLCYPVLSAAMDTPSYRENGEGYLLTRDTMRWFWAQYCPRAADRSLATASPARAARFDGLPDAIVVTAEFDPLRDEGQAYAAQLRAAGNRVEYVCHDGLIHDFLGLAALIPAARPALERTAASLRHAFGG
jgi:acetyl esterase